MKSLESPVGNFLFLDVLFCFQLLSCQLRNSLIAFSTTAGHLRLLSQEMDCSLKNPAAPVAPAFLLFCRSGLLLSIGLADVASPMAAGKATWVAQWWELKSETSSIQAAHQALVLRFGVSCVAVAEESKVHCGV